MKGDDNGVENVRRNVLLLMMMLGGRFSVRTSSSFSLVLIWVLFICCAVFRFRFCLCFAFAAVAQKNAFVVTGRFCHKLSYRYRSVVTVRYGTVTNSTQCFGQYLVTRGHKVF